MTDPIRRAIRTFIQAFVGVIISSLIGEGTGKLPDFNFIETTLGGAVVAGVIATLTFIQNSLEDTNAIPSLAKGSDPVSKP